MRNIVVYIIVFLLMGSACTVKKRVYRPGYNIQWAWKTKAVAKPNNTKLAEVKPEVKEAPVLAGVSDQLILTESEELKNKNLLPLNDTCGDQIFFKSGEKVVVRLLEMTEDKIKYKRCDNLNGPLVTVSKTKIESIQYANGVKELIVATHADSDFNTNTSTEFETRKPMDYSKQELHPMARWSLIIFFFGFILYIPFIMSFLLSKLALKEIDADPESYRGRGMASTVKGLSLGMMIGYFFFFIIMIALALTFF